MHSLANGSRKVQILDLGESSTAALPHNKEATGTAGNKRNEQRFVFQPPKRQRRGHGDPVAYCLQGMSVQDSEPIGLNSAWEAILNLAEAAYAGDQSNQEVIEGLRAQACAIDEACQSCPPTQRKGLQRLRGLLNEPMEQNQTWQPIDWAEWLAEIPSLAELDGRSENGE